MLTTIVKISNVTNLSDARYCAGMGVDMLGFSMDDDQADFVPPDVFEAIRGWVAGVQIVGETQTADIDAIRQLADTYRPDRLEITDAALISQLRPLGLPLLLRLDLLSLTLEQLETLQTDADFVLLETPTPINLDDDLSQAIRVLAAKTPVLLGAGITAQNVTDLLADLPIRGIALRGGNEERPGNKDFGELMDILEGLETD